ncbi:glycine zipper 2TM domain-containing protein [Agitococcus lubricus]|uniref:Glycine zipper 2TM protein n=1 Tax=Agitococcus lubricus TaxID=1077255 RepID=A0A2T5J0J2_9GAMM|nr:glycine zipper 2TM domain-containing protein [Agitococcus lubricus]PTQ89859.1 glycine zipper 2TM protein [Agitococcus lubricus]
MNHSSPTPSLHPLVATASISVILFSGVGIAYMTGLLPQTSSALAPHLTATPSQPATPTVLTPPVSSPTPVLALTTAQSTHTEKQATPSVQTPPVIAPHPPKVDKTAASHKHSNVYKTASQEPEYVLTKPKTTSIKNTNDVATTPKKMESKICDNCGTIVAIRHSVSETQPSGLGAMSGAIIGGVMGHQFGKGDGKRAMTAIGALGGAMAGNQLEQQGRRIDGYHITVQMDNGGSRQFSFAYDPKFYVGENVHVNGGSLQHTY